MSSEIPEELRRIWQERDRSDNIEIIPSIILTDKADEIPLADGLDEYEDVHSAAVPENTNHGMLSSGLFSELSAGIESIGIDTYRSDYQKKLDLKTDFGSKLN